MLQELGRLDDHGCREIARSMELLPVAFPTEL
jgi:hypothetical protein